MDDTGDTGRYKVVINHEEQYSIWPWERENPIGWADAGVDGTKSECLAHIEEVWTDMRPLSLRRWLEEQSDEVPDADGEPALPERDLVEFLASQEHEVVLMMRDAAESERLDRLREREFVQIRFPATAGGTELTVPVDPERSDLSALERDLTEDAEITLVGRLELDYRPVECRATINLKTLRGVGRLVTLERS